MNENRPKVTIVMPVYNSERYLSKAIESILNQTFSDFEFIIVDGGSTDGTVAILALYQKMDDRICACRLENHQGVIAALNRGCYLAKGKYIARMDSDDISLPERLEKQIEYMEAHPEVGVLGTWVECIDETGTQLGIKRLPISSGLTGWCLIFGNCVVHPSVMMRRNVIERLGFYHSEALHVEDYDLWARANSVTRIANVPEVLLQLRIWKGSISSQHFQTQEQNAVKVMHSMITRLLGSEVSIETVANLRRVIIDWSLACLQEIEPIASLIHQLYQTYLKTNSLNRMEAKEVTQDVGGKLYILAVSASKFSLRKSLIVFIQALRFNPRVLSTRIITKGTRMLIGRLQR